MTLGLRPHDIGLAEGPARGSARGSGRRAKFPVKIHLTEPLGDVTVIDVAAQNTMMKMVLREEIAAKYSVGDEIEIAFDPEDLHIFDLWIKHDKPNLFDRIFRTFLPKDYLRLRLTEEPASEMSGTAGMSWLDTGPKDCRNKIFAVTGQDMSYMLDWVGGCEQSGAVPSSFMEKNWVSFITTEGD